MSAPAAEAEFVRPRFSFEREFGQFRNWWARDRRIVGNPMSILMYLVSHDREYRLTQQRVRADLGLGRAAFLAARRRLEDAGFLEAAEHRHPAGTSDAGGNPVGGHRYIVYTLLDPAEPAQIRGNTRDEACAENQPRLSESDLGPVDNPQASAGNPAPDNLPLKEDQVKENQCSSSEAEPVGAATPAGGGMDDDEDSHPGVTSSGHVPGWSLPLEGTLREIDPGLCLDVLLRKLAASGVDPDGVALTYAAADVLAAASRRVGDPTAYVAAAIVREPHRWPSYAGATAQKPLAPHAVPGRGMPPTAAQVAADVRSAKARGLVQPDWPARLDLPPDIAARLAAARSADRGRAETPAWAGAGR